MSSIHTSSKPFRLQGVLRFREIPPVKSVRAYEGVEFSLTTPSGETFALEPGPGASRDQLIAMDGKEVSLEVRRVEPPPPSPMEQAPVGFDGKPQPRPARHEVLAVL